MKLWTPKHWTAKEFPISLFKARVSEKGASEVASGKESIHLPKQELRVQFLGRSPGEGNGNSLQHSFLENHIGRGVWWATVHGVAESDTTEHSSTERQVLCLTP